MVTQRVHDYIIELCDAIKLLHENLMQISRSKRSMMTLLYARKNGTYRPEVLPVSEDIPDDYKGFAAKLFQMDVDLSVVQSVFKDELLEPAEKMYNTFLEESARKTSMESELDDCAILRQIDATTHSHTIVKHLVRFFFCLSCHDRDSWVHHKKLSAVPFERSYSTTSHLPLQQSTTYSPRAASPCTLSTETRLTLPPLRLIGATSALPSLISAAANLNESQSARPAMGPVNIGRIQQAILDSKSAFESFFESVEKLFLVIVSFIEFLTACNTDFTQENDLDLLKVKRILKGLKRCRTSLVSETTEIETGEKEDEATFAAFSMLSSLTVMLEHRYHNQGLKDSLVGLPQSPTLSYGSVPMMEFMEETEEDVQSIPRPVNLAGSTFFYTDAPTSPMVDPESALFMESHNTEINRPRTHRLARIRRTSVASVLDVSDQASICFIPIEEPSRTSPCHTSHTRSEVTIASPVPSPSSGWRQHTSSFSRSEFSGPSPEETFFLRLKESLEETGIQFAEEFRLCFVMGV